MDEGKTVILISKIQLLLNQSLMSVPLPSRDDYGSNECPEMPWLDCETVKCNCSKFPQPGNVIVSTEHVVPNVNDVDDEDNSSDEKNDTPAISADAANQDANVNDCNLDEEIPLYTEYVKLKGCTYHEHFQTVLKSCKLMLQAREDMPIRFFTNQRIWLMTMLLSLKCSLKIKTGNHLDTSLERK